MRSSAEPRHRRAASPRAIALLAVFALTCACPAVAATFTVNIVGDADDVSPGNGICRSAAGPGTCSLRAAITEANARPGHDTIAFAIGSGVKTIMPATALPTISDPVTIDGTTQPGFVDHPLIEVNGEITLSIGFIDGFTITAGDSTIRGLVINTYGGAGITLDGGGNNVIAGNYIGTNVAGDFSGTDFANGGSGVDIFSSSHNRIGGLTLADRNLISGNGLDGLSGLAIYGSDSIGNVIAGNLIGPDITGTYSIGNQVGGILILDAVDTLIGGTDPGAGNVISGNGQGGHGIVVGAAARGTVIQGNFIGTDITGTQELGNSDHGIVLGGDDTLVGGTTPTARNIISGNRFPFTNTGAGVLIGIGAERNRIEGNYIGPDITGTVSIGEQQAGVFITGGSDNLVGGSEPGAGNLISGNDEDGVHVFGDRNVVQGNLIGTDATGLQPLGNCYGVNIAGYQNQIGGTSASERNVIAASRERGIQIFAEPGASRNKVEGNYIGTDITGENLLGNVEVGVRIDTSAGNIIGGTAPGAGNLIAGNGDGVYLGGLTVAGCGITTPDPGSAQAPAANGSNLVQGNVIVSNTGNGVVVGVSHDNVIRDNSISGNALLGIDLGGDGVTPNDALDADTGSNDFQNFPVLERVRRLPGGTAIRGMLTSAPAAQFQLKFYASPSCDPSGYGEGQRLLGMKTVSTDGNGVANFNTLLPASIAPGAFVTATATSTSGSSNTSEFSACISPAPADATS